MENSYVWFNLTIALQCANDVRALASAREPIILATGMFLHPAVTQVFIPSSNVAVLNCIRVLGGYTRAESAETVFDTDDFNEKKYVEYIHSSSGNISLALNWYASSLHDKEATLTQYSFLSIGTILSR